MSHSTTPRVTVICATYNRSNVLPYSIGSVIAQTFVDWELLVVGDNCTDDSASVVAQFVSDKKETRVRWINLVPGTGNQYGPNNEGLAQARGEFIAYIGHDDLWLPHHLEVLVAAMEEGADVAHTAVFWAQENGHGITTVASAACDTPGAVVHRRALTEKFGGWQDYREIVQTPQAEIWSRLRKKGACFHAVPRLSLLKIAAGLRDKVYQSQPNHEQKYWEDRIQKESDLEQKLFYSLLEDTYAVYRSSYLELRGSLSYRVLDNLKGLARGKLPRFNSRRRREPGEHLRNLNRKRGVHQGE